MNCSTYQFYVAPIWQSASTPTAASRRVEEEEGEEGRTFALSGFSFAWGINSYFHVRCTFSGINEGHFFSHSLTPLSALSTSFSTPGTARHGAAGHAALLLLRVQWH